MRVYIASKYLKHKEINREIYDRLKNGGFDAFLPESIDINAKNIQEMFDVSKICYDQIDICDVLLVVSPFGQSVSSEIGYAIGLKRKKKKELKIVLLYTGFDDKVMQLEAMIAPYVDMEISNIKFLISALSKLNISD